MPCGGPHGVLSDIYITTYDSEPIKIVKSEVRTWVEMFGGYEAQRERVG